MALVSKFCFNRIIQLIKLSTFKKTKLRIIDEIDYLRMMFYHFLTNILFLTDIILLPNWEEMRKDS